MPYCDKLDPAAVPPDVSRPDPAKVVKGDPVHTIWNQYDAGGLYCGTWSSTPGAWTVSYSEWEYFHIRQGHSVLTTSEGTEIHLRAGDAHIIHPGFSGTWEVVETTLKDYVIRT
jgi:uncharacterized protein